MTVSDGYCMFVVDALGRSLPDIRSRKMFGGVGIYSGDLFFALLDDDTLYFKVDDETRPDFEAIGMGPFQPFGEGGETMQYYQVPVDLLEDSERLAIWAERALGVARRAQAKRPRRKRK